jgi:hypothetical protein
MDGMSRQAPAHIEPVFEQLRQLGRSLDTLQALEAQRVESLRGHQTVDAEEAMALSFNKIRGDIASIEETLKAIAEATGEIPKR